MTKYTHIKPPPNSELETSVLRMCFNHFGEKPPYVRKLGDEFLSDTLAEIRKGDVHIAKHQDGSLIGLCIVCAPDIDNRVAKYASQYECDIYLAALIIQEEHRGQGYAKNLLLKALKGKTGKLILITPEKNAASIGLYKKCGMEIVAEFDQMECHFHNGEDFNLRRVVMAGSVPTITTSAQTTHQQIVP